jgi:putative hydrolase of the HAD superfamily
MIKAVVFDFDGLIIDTELALYEAFRKLLKLEANEFPISQYASYIGTDSKALYDFIEEKANGTMTLEEIIKKSSLLHKDNLKDPIARDGVEDYLRQAKNLGMKIGLASSSDREWVTFFLEVLNLIEYFDIIQTKDDVETVKPDPTLYQNVINYFGVDPSEAIAFEDSANGAKAAVAAGLKCVIVPNKITENLPFENIHLRLDSMKDKEFSAVIKVIESLYV